MKTTTRLALCAFQCLVPTLLLTAGVQAGAPLEPPERRSIPSRALKVPQPEFPPPLEDRSLPATPQLAPPATPAPPPRAARQPPPFQNRLAEIVTRTGPRTASVTPRPLIVSFAETNPVVIRALEEDLIVLHHILAKSVSSADTPGDLQTMGLALRGLPDHAADHHVMYLEDYGAVFVLQASFPLMGAARARREPPREHNSEWERAREELFGAPGTSGGLPGRIPAVPEYDPERVEQLTNALLQALKNGSRIRHLRSEDWVSVAVVSSQSRSQLLLRVKKADIDAFAKGELDLEGFREKAFVTGGIIPTVSFRILRARRQLIVKDATRLNEPAWIISEEKVRKVFEELSPKELALLDERAVDDGSENRAGRQQQIFSDALSGHRVGNSALFELHFLTASVSPRTASELVSKVAQIYARLWPELFELPDPVDQPSRFLQ
jgi:hypothetical protein